MVVCQMNLFLLSFHIVVEYFSGVEWEGWELAKKRAQVRLS